MRPEQSPSPHPQVLVLRDCQVRLSQIHSKHDILTGREELEVIPSVLFVPRWEMACCIFATVHCEANFELKTSCTEHIHWVYARTTHFYYNCVIDKILAFTELTYIIVLSCPIRILLRENFYLHFADDEIETSMIKEFALGYHLERGRDGICIHTIALSATSQASFSTASVPWSF